MSIYTAHRRKKTPLMRSMCRVLIKNKRLQCTTKTVNQHVRLTQLNEDCFATVLIKLPCFSSNVFYFCLRTLKYLQNTLAYVRVSFKKWNTYAAYRRALLPTYYIDASVCHGRNSTTSGDHCVGYILTRYLPTFYTVLQKSKPLDV